MEKFTNGFDSWQETHFEVVQFITTLNWNDTSGNVMEVNEAQGTGGLYELAKEWTDEFEKKYKGVIWGEEMEYFDTIEEFLTNKNKI